MNACANQVVLGQLKNADKFNEISAIPELIELLDIQETLVSIDAIGCQTAIAETIVNKESGYLFTLKANQGSLHDAL